SIGLGPADARNRGAVDSAERPLPHRQSRLFHRLLRSRIDGDWYEPRGSQRGSDPVRDRWSAGDPREPAALERLRWDLPDSVRRYPLHRDELPCTSLDGAIEPDRRVLREPTAEVAPLRCGPRETDLERGPHGDLVAVLLARDARHPLCVLPRRGLQHEGRLPPPGLGHHPTRRPRPTRPSHADRAQLAGRERNPPLIRRPDTRGR